MILIFDKNNNGAIELKERLGFIDAATEFIEVRPFLTREYNTITSLISSDIYEIAYAHYMSEDFNEEEQTILDELVILIQTTQALYAWHKYAPFKDLSHSNAGRRLRIDSDHERMPSDKLLKKSDEQILQLAHSTMDELLKFLDDNIDNEDFGEEWQNSTQYETRKSLMVSSVEEFETVFPIFGSARTYYVLIPFLKEAQRDYVKPLFSETDYVALIEEMLEGNISAGNKIIIEKARIPIVFSALNMAVKRLSVQILDKGIFRNVMIEEASDTEKQPADSAFYSKIATTLQTEAQKGLNALSEHISRLNIEAAGGIYEYVSLADSVDTNKKYVRL